MVTSCRAPPEGCGYLTGADVGVAFQLRRLRVPPATPLGGRRLLKPRNTQVRLVERGDIPVSPWFL